MGLGKEHKPEVINGIPKKFNMVVFGPPKVGKTTFGASAEKSLLIECEENGARHIPCVIEECKSLNQLRTIFGQLLNDKTFETVIIDSLDVVAHWVEQEVCENLGLSTIMDTKGGYGSQWVDYKEGIMKLIKKFCELDKRVIFLAHITKADVNMAGSVVNSKTINLYGKTAADVLAYVDNIGHMFVREGQQKKYQHILSFKAGSIVESGSRHPAIAGKEIVLPKENSFKAFEDCFKS